MEVTIDQDEFRKVLLTMSDDVRTDATRLGAPLSVVDHMIRTISENVGGGKGFRGLTVPETAKALLGRPLSTTEFRELSILGWLVEMFGGALLILDDIMDESTTRRGKPCWYKRPDVGLNAVNDGTLALAEITILLKRYFKHHPSYVDFLESFGDISYRSEIGQTCDGLATMEKDPMNWTWDQYYTINKFKCGYYTFHFSTLLALQYLGRATSKEIEYGEKVLATIGGFYQLTNDFLDIFGDSARTGKVGTDIIENKCSWVILKALEICNDEERTYLRESYGTSEPDVAAKVHAILISLPLKALYFQEEVTMKSKLSKMIDELPEGEGLPRDLYWKFWACIEWCSKQLVA